jgi:hypothetical protein
LKQWRIRDRRRRNREIVRRRRGKKDRRKEDGSNKALDRRPLIECHNVTSMLRAAPVSFGVRPANPQTLTNLPADSR